MSDGADNKFLITCSACAWKKYSSGTTEDLAGLKEIPKTCNCGKPRQFRCPECNAPAKMLKV